MCTRTRTKLTPGHHTPISFSMCTNRRVEPDSSIWIMEKPMREKLAAMAESLSLKPRHYLWSVDIIDVMIRELK